MLLSESKGSSKSTITRKVESSYEARFFDRVLTPEASAETDGHERSDLVHFYLMLRTASSGDLTTKAPNILT